MRDEHQRPKQQSTDNIWDQQQVASNIKLLTEIYKCTCNLDLCKNGWPIIKLKLIKACKYLANTIYNTPNGQSTANFCLNLTSVLRINGQ